MKEIYIFIFIILLSTIINNFVGGFLFDNLKIFSELIQTKEKPRIIFISDNNKVLAGESLFISCISTGNPVPDIQWYVDRMPIVRIMKSNSESISRFQNRYLSMNFKMKKIAKSTLIFKKVLLEDNNNLLTCESENVMGTDSQTTKIRVFKHEMSVNFPMVSLEDSSKSTLKRENSAATIKCQYHNSLNAKVYWFRNYEFINEPEYEITLDKSVSKFSIKNIMRKDEGTYHCFVTGHSGGQISKPIKIIISDIPPPTTNVTVTERTSTSSVICWKLPFNNLTIEQFVLHYESREQIESVSIPFEKILNDFNGWQCYTLKKLHPFTTYRIWINSLNSLGKSQVGKSVKFNTSEDLPQGPPTSITASAISNTAVEVRWKSVEKINGILKKYILLWTEHSDLPHQHWRQYDAKSESSLISHLTPNRIHYITIQAVNNVGKGPLSKPVAILTKSGTISECPEFRASKILLKSIVLEWNDPDPTKTLNCFGLNLEISYKSPLYSMENKIVNITTNQFSFEIHNVKEDTEIVFTLRAFNQVGFGMPVKLLIVSAGKAKINKNVVDIIGCTSFTIVARWRQPNKDAKNMTLQLFEKNGKSFTLIVYRTLPIIRSEFQIDEWKIYNFTRLKPSQKYQIRLTFLVVGEFNEIRESFYLSNVIETKKAHPQSVGNFNLKTGVNLKGHPNVMAEWEEIPIFDKVFSSAIYHLKYRIIFPAELSTKYRSIYTNKSSHVIQLLELPKYGVTYEFVLARYGNVSEKLSVKKLIAMPEGKPSESPSVIKVIYMSERKVTLKWKNPHIKFRNGKLIYNEVQIMPLNQILNSTDNTISFYKLPNKVYQLRVRSCTRVACGPWSKYFEFSVYDVEILPPKEIRAFRVMDTKIRVEWSIGYDQNRMPYVFSKNLLGFVIYYSTRDTLNVTSAWSQIKIYDNISRYEIKNIEKKFFYIVRMSSIDQYNRTGKWSEPSVPENVDLSSYSIKTFSNLQCYQTTSNSIELRADYPVDNTFLNSILVTYSGRIIFWSPLNPESVEFVSEKEISLDYNKKETIFKLNLKDLNVNTKYIIRIFPIYSTNSKFDSNITLSTNTHCDTKPIAPVLVLPPKIVQISTFFIILQLMRTDERNGRIDYYHLIVVPYMSKSKMVFEEYNKSSREFSLIELKTNAKQNKLILPILALSRKPIQLFGNQPHYDFLFTYNFTKPNKMDRFSDGNFYRSALRACVETDEGHFLCNTSDWSESFQINFILQDELKVQNSKNTEKILKPKHNDKAVITLSLTLSGITLAIVGIIIGCVVHKRKLPSKKWENSCRSSTPKIQQDAQMTPLVDLDTPKLDQEPYYLRTDQNYGFDTNNEVINYKNYINSSVTINNYDSPILKNTKVSANHQNTTPDIVNVSDRFNFFNNDSVQVSSNVLKSRYTIPIDKLAEYINDLKSYDYLNMMQEFEELNKETLEKYSSINSNLPQNKMKNRYANITAYDHSIVPLQNPLDRDHCNYINANYIDGYGKQNEYIATQGPLAETAYDFWQMVWEQKSTIIVMLVRNEETESKKCEIYWPKKGTRIYYDIEVTLVSFISRAYYTIRKFQIKQNGFSTKRQVYQLQFTGWPDQGIPILFLPFLSFLKIYKKFSKSDSGPTIVHCSAGVGRTGVFIVVDSQMERIKHDRTVNIYDQIKAIRKQRNFMVQTEAQYGFIYDVLLEWNQGNYSEIVPDMLISQIKSKSQIVENNSLSGFEIEFQKLNLQSTTINSNMSRIHGNATVNKQKNNSPHLIPFDWNRVALSSMSGVDGSDYINASYIDSYLKTKAYIVSQDPMASTVEDFWRLVWDQNCSIIVVLGKIEEFMKELSLPYWPVQKSIRYQFFVVDPMVEYNMSNYIMREFKVTDARDGEFKTVRQFHYSKWLNNICPCDAHSFLEFIHQVQLTKENFGHGNPLLVHCSYGTGKSGIFIALNNILEKLNQESLIDVYDTVKLLQQQRVGLVQTVDQYKFCYLSILTHMIDINPDFKAQFCGFKEYLSISNKKTTTAVNE